MCRIHRRVVVSQDSMAKNKVDDKKQGCSLAKKIIIIALIILVALVAVFALFDSGKFNSKNLSSNRVASFSTTPRYCILPTSISTKSEFNAAVKEMRNHVLLKRVKQQKPGKVIKDEKIIKDNCRKIVGGVCLIKTKKLPKDPPPQPYEFTHMKKTLKWLNNSIAISSYTAPEIKFILCAINQKLHDDKDIICHDDNQLLQGDLLNQKLKLSQSSRLPTLTHYDDVIDHLKRRDPTSIDAFKSISTKFDDKTGREIKDIIKNLNSAEQKFFKDYKIEMHGEQETALGLLNELSKKIVGWNKEFRDDPYEIASQSYTLCSMYAPFARANQKTAYVFTNFILTRMGLDPVIFKDLKDFPMNSGDSKKDSNKFKEYLKKMHKYPLDTTQLLAKCQKKVEECSRNLLIQDKIEPCDLTIES